MAEFRMPSLGADMDEGVLLEWHIAVGDHVERGDIVADVDTDKSVIEVETFATGTVQELLVAEGERVPVGTPLAIIAGSPSVELVETPVPELVETPVPEPVEGPPSVAPVETKAVLHQPGDAIPEPVDGPPSVEPVEGPVEGPPSVEPVETKAPQPTDHRLAVSPLGRRRARQLGVDLSEVTGTGHHGAITAQDVEAYAKAHPAPGQRESEAAPEPRPAPAAAAGEDRQTRIRRAIAASMARSKREIPHYSVSANLDLSAATQWLAAHNAAVPVTERVLPAALLLKATAVALRKHPRLNGFYVDDAFRPGDGIHLGVAIALRGGGLVAPAIREADTLSVSELMAKLRDLTGRAKAGRLRSSEFADPTITVTNLGDAGADSVLPVIYPPQVAIVGFGRIRERPWAEAGGLFARPVVTATLAADHRVGDGHAGALFLGDLDRVLTHPAELEEA